MSTLAASSSLSYDADAAQSIHDAALRGDYLQVSGMLAQQPELAAQPDCRGDYLIHSALFGGYEKVISAIVRANPSMIAVSNARGETCLHAVANSYYEGLAGNRHTFFLFFVKTCQLKSIDLPDNEGLTPLHHAAQEGFDRIIVELGKAGTTAFCAQDKQGRTPLHLAISAKKTTTIRLLVELAREAGKLSELLDIKSKKEGTPFQLADAVFYSVSLLHKELAKLLSVERREEVRQTSKRSRSSSSSEEEEEEWVESASPEKFIRNH